jgi:hypothetical protein
VTFAEGENSLTLHGYAAAMPQVKVESGTAGTVNFDAATRYFTVEIHVNEKAHLDHESGDPVRHAVVTMTLPKGS